MAGEEGIVQDGEAVFLYIARHSKIAPGKIFILGESLGGAVAVRMCHKLLQCRSSSSSGSGGDEGEGAQQVQPQGLALVNTFTSISSLVDTLLPAFGKFLFLFYSSFQRHQTQHSLSSTTCVCVRARVRV